MRDGGVAENWAAFWRHIREMSIHRRARLIRLAIYRMHAPSSVFDRSTAPLNDGIEREGKSTCTGKALGR